MCKAEVGSTLSIKGYFTKIAVEQNQWKNVGISVGGSEIKPCLQVAEKLMSSPNDTTESTLNF